MITEFTKLNQWMRYYLGQIMINVNMHSAHGIKDVKIIVPSCSPWSVGFLKHRC